MTLRALGLWVVLASSIAVSATASRAEVKEIRIALQFGLFNLPVTVAEAQGYFRERARKAGIADLNVSIQRFTGGSAMNDALLSGNTDVALYGPTALLVAWDKTKGQQNIAALTALATYPIILFTNKPEVRSFADFGKEDRIAVPGHVSPHAVLMRMAAERFYGPDKYAEVDHLLVTMSHPDATAALISGKTGISGYVASPPFSDVLRKSDKVHAVVSSKDFFGGNDATIALLAAKKEFVDTNPIVAKVIIAALEDGIALIALDPGTAADIYIKSEASKITKGDLLESLGSGGIVYSVSPSGLMTFARFMAKTGTLKNVPVRWQDVFFPLIHERSGN
jgi:NitT/TauT family transport system substrate-binding protein